MPWTQAGPGRPKGSKNRTKLEIAEWSRHVLENPQYRENLMQRLIEGKAPHIETLLYHYAYGKPVDRIQLVAPMVYEVNRLAELYGITAEAILVEAEAIAIGQAS